MLRQATLAAIALAVATTTFAAPASAGKYDNRRAIVEKLLDDEANGGPVIEGGISHGQSRTRVCRELPTRDYDEDGLPITVVKKTCWFE